MKICVLLSVTKFWCVTPRGLVKKHQNFEGIAASFARQRQRSYLSARLYGVTSEFNPYPANVEYMVSS